MWRPPHKIVTGPLPEVVAIDYSHRANPEFVDFTGMRFKDITVVGLIGRCSGTSAGWLCRCTCGNYLTRKAKALKLMAKNANSPLYCCDECADYYMLDRGQPVGEN